MTATFPNFPTSGKNSRVEISTSDGTELSLQPMVKQDSFEHKGKTYSNRVYLLGAGMTALNMRPEKQPQVYVDGILEGLNIAPGAADDTIAVSAGTIEVDGAVKTVAADGALSLDNASANKCWNAIVVDVDTQALSVVKGTDGLTLLDTFGDGAGERPMVPADKILIGWVAVGTTTYAVQASDIDRLKREEGGVDYEILPNVGGALIQRPLAEIHASTIGGEGTARAVKFSGSYLDDVMSIIGTAKSWGLTANSTDISDETFAGGYSQSSISGFSVTFEQLAADKKVLDAAFKREGHCFIRVLLPSGFGWQSAATVVPSLTVSPTAMNSISVTASLSDFPVEYTG